MRYISTIIAGALLTGASTMALAQDQDGSNQLRLQRDQQQNMHQLGAGQQPYFTPRATQRANLRRQMRREGFQNIRISDAIFVVQAQTPDGRDVVMVVKPTRRSSDSNLQSSNQNRQGRQDEFQMGSNQDRNQDRNRQQFGYGNSAPDYDAMVDQGQAGQQNQNRQTASNNNARDMSGDATGSVSTSQNSNELMIRQRLQSRGFSNIDNWERDGDVLTATADWYGEEVDVRVDANSGRVLQPTSLQPSQVRNLLTLRGFSNIKNVRRNGNVITAEADRNGRTYVIDVDPRLAQVDDEIQPKQGG